MGAATMTTSPAHGRAPEPEAADARVELLVTEPKGWDDEEMGFDRRSGDPMPADAVAEARNVAQRLRALADEGAAAGDMVVLLRAFTHVDAFEEALDRVGLAPYVAGGGGYWSQQQTQDLICLLSAVANPLADEQMLGVLASPACGVSPDTLWLLRRALGSGRTIWRAIQAVAGGKEIDDPDDPDALGAIADADRERLTRIHEVLHNLQRLGARLPLESLVEQAITQSGYDLGVLGADHGPARFANVTKLMRLARDYERVEGRDLRGFLDFAALATAQDDEPPAAVEAEEGEGVKIMTTHSAKGLGVPDRRGRRAWPRHRPRRPWRGPRPRPRRRGPAARRAAPGADRARVAEALRLRRPGRRGDEPRRGRGAAALLRRADPGPRAPDPQRRPQHAEPLATRARSRSCGGCSSTAEPRSRRTGP